MKKSCLVPVSRALVTPRFVSGAVNRLHRNRCKSHKASPGGGLGREGKGRAALRRPPHGSPSAGSRGAARGRVPPGGPGPFWGPGRGPWRCPRCQLARCGLRRPLPGPALFSSSRRGKRRGGRCCCCLWPGPEAPRPRELPPGSGRGARLRGWRGGGTGWDGGSVPQPLADWPRSPHRTRVFPRGLQEGG